MPRHACATAIVWALLLTPVALSATAQTAPTNNQSTTKPAATRGLYPNLEGQLSTPLRYQADGEDFVIRNGNEYFNRALYGGNTAFRVDAGDKPEFSLYLPGRGGNLRLGIKTAQGVKWLNHADTITARYRPGEMLYTIQDPLIGASGRIELVVLALHQTEGVMLRASGQGLPAGAELVIAYGGGNGVRGARDGDIGTEKVPISEYFQFKPEYAADTTYSVTNTGFVADGKAAGLTGQASGQVRWQLADARLWDDASGLLTSSGDAPIKVVTGTLRLSATPVYVGIEVTRRGALRELGDYSDVRASGTALTESDANNAGASTPKPANMAARFEASRKHFTALRQRVQVVTPDAYLNAAVGALNVAADGVWDENSQGAGITHGAIAWRTRLVGWRGPYALDALGWHDRARRNFDLWTVKQNTQPIPDTIASPAEATHLARNPDALHSNGDLTNAHYDMNVGFFDAMFRHILWTGDLDYVREVWPVIERHMAWEKRLFRREYGAEKLPLYEGYAAIWASDEIQYNGGGAAYTTAYNLYHNRMVARLAKLIGKDPTPYEQEADLIAKGMRANLWMPERGAFAEFRDLLGNQLLHPSYGLWSFYHTVDSGVPDAFEAARMAADIDNSFRRVPITGAGVPDDRPYHMLPTTDWMPYHWSTNNMVMGENLHTALALWQAGRPDSAYDITRGSILGSFFMGIAPGNVGSLNYLDVYRRESQRDFADGIGVMSRTIVEGLFGIQPDALNRTLTIVPGFPPEWDHARITHPNLSLSFERKGQTDRWRISQTGKTFEQLVLDIPARTDKVSAVRVNGRTVKWTAIQSVGTPKLRIESPLSASANVEVVWAGQTITDARSQTKPASQPQFSEKQQGDFSWFALNHTASPPQACPMRTPDWARAGNTISAETVDISAAFNDKVTTLYEMGKYRTPRSPFVSMALPAQGIGGWAGNVNDMFHVKDDALRAAGGEVTTLNGLKFRTPSGDQPNVLFTSQWDNYPSAAEVPLSGKASRAYLMMAGSTNQMQSRLINGEVIVTYTDGTTSKLELRNPDNWWPVERDFFIDDYQFRLCGEVPVRFDMQTGKIFIPQTKGYADREKLAGGSANLLYLDLDPTRTLKSLSVHSVANDVVIGLMGVSLVR
ncbi:MAG: DUF4450 domain-containing protein [Asticcacaulis sp.]